jgi:PKD repeat protein
MKVKWIVGILLVLLLVGTVSATTLILNSTNDGVLQENSGDFNGTWADFHHGVGTQVTNDPATELAPQMLGASTSGYYEYLIRGMNTFDGSSIPDAATINDAVVSVYGIYKETGLGNPKTAIIDATPASYTTYIAADFSATSFTRMSDTDVVFNGAGWNNFTLNAAGLAKINKTGDFAFMFTSDKDADDTEVTWGSAGRTLHDYRPAAYLSENNNPIITINYTLGTVSTYPVSTINETRFLPNSDTNLPPSGLNMSLNAAPGEYEPASFIIKPSGAVTDIQVTTTSLTDVDGTGHTAIPNTSIDVRTVKVWYQPENDAVSYVAPDYLLTPELLLKNDTIISCNYTNQNCSVWVSNATFFGYFAVDNTTIDEWQSDYKVYDNATASGDIQPFGMAANENRQILMTVNVSPTQSAGNYTGSIYINSSSTTSVKMNLTVRILPFSLVNSTKEQAIYYGGTLELTTPTAGTSDHKSKTESQYSLELTDMKNHGIGYPTNYNWYFATNASYVSKFEKSLQLRNESGLPLNHIYLLESFINNYHLTSSDPVVLADLVHEMDHLKTSTTAYGFNDVYGYGIDEPSAAQVLTERDSFTTVINNGSKTYFATNQWGTSRSIADLTSLVLTSSSFNETDIGLWKSANPSIKIFSYANPQLGVEDPEIYRTNYGFKLWRSGYNGAMDFAYQWTFGQSIWNDYDSPDAGGYYYKDHVMAYPKTDGVIDTIQWEGYREGVDDNRYADTLSYITGNTTEATTIINAGIAAGDDMSVIRAHLIDHILAYGDAVIPTASFTKSRSIVRIPQTVTFTDTSTNTPTSWTWYWFDNETASNTTQNPTVQFTTIGTKNIRLYASNAAGGSWSNDTIEVTEGIASFTSSATNVCPSTWVQFTDTSTNIPTSWYWDFEMGASVDQNPLFEFNVAGVYDVNMSATNAYGTNWTNNTGYINVSTGFCPAPATPATPDRADAYRGGTAWIFVIIGLVFLIPMIILAAQAITTLRTGELDMMVVAGIFVGILILIAVFGFMVVLAGALGA